MLNAITIVSIVMTVLFLVAVYDALKSINEAHNESVASHEVNELTLNIAEEDVIYPIYKSYRKTHTFQEHLNTLYKSVTDQFKDPNLSTSQKWPYDTPHPIPFHNLNAKILHHLSQTS